MKISKFFVHSVMSSGTLCSLFNGVRFCLMTKYCTMLPGIGLRLDKMMPVRKGVHVYIERVQIKDKVHILPCRCVCELFLKVYSGIITTGLRQDFKFRTVFCISYTH